MRKVEVFSLLGFITILLTLLSPPANAYNLYAEFAVPETQMNGRLYPQNHRLVYSGTTKKRVSLGRAVNAMLGTEDIHYNSYTYMKVLNCLMKVKDRKCLRKGFIKYLPPGRYSHLVSNRNFTVRNLVSNARTRNGGHFTDYQKASRAAQEIMDQYFLRLGKNTIYRNFVKFKYTIENLLPRKVNTQNLPWPSEVIYSSVQSYISALYGGRVLVFNEAERRSLDLGYWNLVNSGYWYSTKKDMGEFITAGYLKGKDIVGYQIRNQTGSLYRPSQSRSLPVYHSIKIAFYKEVVDGVPYVLVLQSNGIDCIEKVASFNYAYCVNPRFSSVPFYKPKKLKKYKKKPAKARAMLKKIQADPNFFPRISGSGPTLIGVYSLRDAGVPNKIFAKYQGVRRAAGQRDIKWLQKEVDSENLADIEFFPVH